MLAITSHGLGDLCIDYGVCEGGGTGMMVDPSTYPNIDFTKSPTYVQPSGSPWPFAGGSTPSYNPTISPKPSFWSTLTAGLFGAGSILGTRYAVPQLNPGQFISTNASGSTMYQLAPGQTSMPIGSSFNMGNIGGYLPLLLIGGVVLFAVSKMGK